MDLCQKKFLCKNEKKKKKRVRMDRHGNISNHNVMTSHASTDTDSDVTGKGCSSAGGIGGKSVRGEGVSNLTSLTKYC